jgi:hypothetical protein
LLNIKSRKAQRSTTTARLLSFSELAITFIKFHAWKALNFKRNGKKRLKSPLRRMFHKPLPLLKMLRIRLNHKLKMLKVLPSNNQKLQKKHPSKSSKFVRRTKRQMLV